MPSVVFGRSAVVVFSKYKDTVFQYPDVQRYFPDVLRAFQDPHKQLFLDSSAMNRFVVEPDYLRRAYAPAADDSILILLLLDADFQALFRDGDFHAIIKSTGELNTLIRLIPQPTTQLPEDCEIPEPEPPKATTLEIVLGNDQSGEFGELLAQELVVGVKDQNGSPLPNIGVTFRARTSTSGVKFSNQSTSTESTSTDSFGLAKTTLTLGSQEGENQIEASAAGISSPQIFTVTAIAPPPPEPEPEPEPVMPDPPLTPEPPQFPPVYWIEGGTLYRESPIQGVEKLEVHKPTNGTLTGGLAMDMEGGRIYWTEETADGMGRVLSANFAGGDLQIAKEIEAVPYGIAVGSDKGNNRWIYWTTSTGKIQRIKVNGSGFNGNLVSNVDSPMHIAFDEVNHQLYWTEASRIRSVSANGKGKKENVVENLLGHLGGIAVAEGVVYWTESIGSEQGVVKSQKGNGSGQKLLAVLAGVPAGVAVDAAGGRVYWTTSLGGVESAPIIEVIETVVKRANIPTTGIALGNGSLIPLSSVAAAPSISSVGPQESTLLANYPNPFNPETWIPYQLSESADVRVSIYAVNGSLVRQLDLGHQSAGVYRNRSRAAYWDGRNEFGERVASGLYFYTLTAGDFSATRKMLIRK